MRRYSLNTFAILSLGLGLSTGAHAQSPAQTTPSKLDKLSDPNAARKETAISNDSLDKFGLKLKFDGLDLVLEGNLPPECTAHIKFEVEPKNRNTVKLDDIFTIEDLKSASTQLVPQLTFDGVNELPTLEACLKEAKAEKKQSALYQAKEAALQSSDEIASVDIKNGSKSSQFVKLENELAAFNCTNCNETPTGARNTLRDKKDSDLTHLLAALAKKPLEAWDRQVIEANTESALTNIRTQLLSYAKEVEQLNISAEEKKNLLGGIFEVLTQQMPRRALELGSSNSLMASAPGDSGKGGSDLWSTYLVGNSPQNPNLVSSGSAARWLNFIAKTLEEASTIQGVDSETSKQHVVIAKQLRTRGSEVRLAMIAQMDPNHQEVEQALYAASQYRAATLQQFNTFCSRGIHPQNFAQCGALIERHKKFDQVINTYGPKYQAAANQDQSFWQMNLAGMNSQIPGQNAGQSYWTQPGTVQWNQPIGQQWNQHGYSGQNFNQMYQNTAANTWSQHQPNVSSGSGVQIYQELPVAIPLRNQSFPQQGFPNQGFTPGRV